jgi:hypothetical protein
MRIESIIGRTKRGFDFLGTMPSHFKICHCAFNLYLYEFGYDNYISDNKSNHCAEIIR